MGTLYDDALGRMEEAVAFLRQAADKYVEIGDAVGEGRQKGNLAICLRKLRRLDEARQEAQRAIECKAQLGHAALPWTSWAILALIETDAGDPAAARSLLQEQAARFEAAGFGGFVHALQAIADRSRAPSLAEAPALSYGMPTFETASGWVSVANQKSYISFLRALRG